MLTLELEPMQFVSEEYAIMC